MNDNEMTTADKRNPFSVPDGYFDDFPDRILARIRKEEKPAVRLVPYLRYIAIAACILMLFAAGMMLRGRMTPSVMVADADDDQTELLYLLKTRDLMTALADAEIEEGIFMEYSEEQKDEIILFLERDNIAIADIARSMNGDNYVSYDE
ncbi:MAG: hypothetical protein LBS09_07535 [Bacteroidales bacterium]|jgi:hypothetical protein|nr:hypothetical protein [Bacteroidales bacterium]